MQNGRKQSTEMTPKELNEAIAATYRAKAEADRSMAMLGFVVAAAGFAICAALIIRALP